MSKIFLDFVPPYDARHLVTISWPYVQQVPRKPLSPSDANKLSKRADAIYRLENHVILKRGHAVKKVCVAMLKDNYITITIG